MAPVPTDRPFYCIDAYGEVQHVEWIGEQGGPFGPYVGVIDSDGDCFPISDISDWDDDLRTLTARHGPYCCRSCTAGTWNEDEHCDECEAKARAAA